MVVTPLFSLTSVKTLELEQPLREVGFNPCQGLVSITVEGGLRVLPELSSPTHCSHMPRGLVVQQVFMTMGDLMDNASAGFQNFCPYSLSELIKFLAVKDFDA